MDQLNQFLIARQQIFIEPNQKMINLQIAKVLRRETFLARLHSVQFQIARIARNQAVVIRLEEILQNEVLLRLAQLFGGRERAIEKRIGRFSRSIFVDLRDHRRHQVERFVNRRKFGENLNHSGVVFERVEPRPRQFVLSGPQIFVERLMHVPQKTDGCH